MTGRDWTPIEHPAELRRQRRAEPARRQRRADAALGIALGVVILFLLAFVAGGLAMLAGWEMFG